MFLLDADTFTLLEYGHARVTQHMRVAEKSEEVALTIITRIEILQGRFAFMLKAANKTEWLHAYELLHRWETRLSLFRIIGVDEPSADEFERLSKIKSLRKIGRPGSPCRQHRAGPPSHTRLAQPQGL
jgi:tRNA(fMet)-specific endonuclease VapC